MDPSLHRGGGADAALMDRMDPAIAHMSAASPYPPPPAPEAAMEHAQHQQQHQEAGVGHAMPPQEDVDQFLRKKRKAREHKACYPCRQRKVKCDLSRPCQTCRDREHPELCSYHPPNKRQNMDQSGPPTLKQEELPSGSGFVTLGRSEFDMLCRKLNGLESSMADLKRELRRTAHDRTPMYESGANANVNSNSNSNALAHAITGAQEPHIDPAVENYPPRPTHQDVHGVHVKNDAGGYTHLGGGSIPGMLYALQVNQGNFEQDQLQERLGKQVLPLFGLDNESATYPFVDLWGLPHASINRGLELAKALPGDSQMLDLFRCYRDVGHVIYPGIVSPEQLESEMTMFMINRATKAGSDEGVTEQQLYSRSYTWLALLFAVLASGAQCSGMPRKERELTSQVYVCCSFECLRFTNFLSSSNLESLQSIIVIGNVIQNNLNAGTSWSLLGLTIRLAQGLGIHRACPPTTPVELVYPRSKIWWSIIWQDSLLSITYDRTSCVSALDVHTMPPPQQILPTGGYHSAMYRLAKCGLDIVRDRSRQTSPREQIATIAQHRETLADVMRDSSDYLRDSRKCTSPRETIEHWALYLHSSYHLSELCRPAISPNADPDLARAFKQTCIDNLVNTIEAFLGLNNITSFARQSWAALHRALGSALLLGILGEHTRNERARHLLARFMAVLSEITHNVSPQEVSAPISRGLSALRKLSIHDAGGKRFLEDIMAGNANTNGTDGKAGAVGVSEGGMTVVGEDGMTVVGEDGKLKLSHESMVTPANSDAAEEDSPYSVLNTILWGNAQGSAGERSGLGPARPNGLVT